MKWRHFPGLANWRNFTTHAFDYPTDTDGVGVADPNDEMAGTHPSNSSSTPVDSTIDILALYSPEFAEHVLADPYTGIQHTILGVSDIFRQSRTGVRLRIVGIAEIALELGFNSHKSWTHLSLQEARRMQDLHGADLVVQLHHWPAFNGAKAHGKSPLHSTDDASRLTKWLVARIFPLVSVTHAILRPVQSDMDGYQL